MIYREFGNTGLQVSALGFGCMRFPLIGKDNTMIDEEQATEMIRLAIEKGVNYFDTAYPYHAENFSKPGKSETFLAKALQNGYREKVYLATKLPCWLVESREDMDRILDEQLERLDTEYIDFYLLHALNRSSWAKMIKNGVLDFLGNALSNGKIRYAGFSFHDEVDLFKEIVDAYNWSFCQIMYNYFDEDFQAGREGLTYASRRGLAILAMEPLRGGALVNGLPGEARKVLHETDPGKSAVEWAFQWLWSQPEVTVVLSGMSSLDQLKENLDLAKRASGASWTERESEAILQVKRVISNLQRVNCTDCGYCIPCPEGVNIPRNFSLINDHHMLNDPAARNRYYALLGEKERAASCVECGECLEKCPQQIAIPDELQHVAELFG
ncbi:MAG: aldo/keto reductase [Bacteroidetes bacterium]|nr:aldo/keto reductase [Bacteroidota bacterium]